LFLRESIGGSDFTKLMGLAWRMCVSDEVLVCGAWLRPRPGDENPLLFGHSLIQDVINRNNFLFRVNYFFKKILFKRSCPTRYLRRNFSTKFAPREPKVDLPFKRKTEKGALYYFAKYAR